VVVVNLDPASLECWHMSTNFRWIRRGSRYLALYRVPAGGFGPRSWPTPTMQTRLISQTTRTHSIVTTHLHSPNIMCSPSSPLILIMLALITGVIFSPVPTVGSPVLPGGISSLSNLGNWSWSPAAAIPTDEVAQILTAQYPSSSHVQVVHKVLPRLFGPELQLHDTSAL
jgi:hypothetical protein